jgi:hypothetical protein
VSQKQAIKKSEVPSSSLSESERGRERLVPIMFVARHAASSQFHKRPLLVRLSSTAFHVSPNHRSRRRDEEDGTGLEHHQSQLFRQYHGTSERRILPLIGAIVVTGLGFAAYRKIQGQSVVPVEARRAQEAYRRQTQEKETKSTANEILNDMSTPRMMSDKVDSSEADDTSNKDEIQYWKPSKEDTEPPKPQERWRDSYWKK